MLDHSFHYLELLLTKKDINKEEQEESKDEKYQSISNRIIDVGKFLNRTYSGSLEFFYFYSGIEKFPGEE